MTDVDRTLAAIDEAIDGYVTWDPAVSDDAMRWAPEEMEEPDQSEHSAGLAEAIRLAFNCRFMSPAGAPALRLRAQDPTGWLHVAGYRSTCTQEQIQAWFDNASHSDREILQPPTTVDPPRQFPPCMACGAPADSVRLFDEDRVSFSPCGCELRVVEPIIRRSPFASPASSEQVERLNAWAAEMSQGMRRALRPLGQFSKAVASVSMAFGAVRDANHARMAPRLFGDDYRRHRRRCPICNPNGFPKPLAANGREYTRRTHARRRRNRR